MSEANAPFNPQGQPESIDSAAIRKPLPEATPTEGAESLSMPADPQPYDINSIFDASALDDAAFEDPSQSPALLNEAVIHHQIPPGEIPPGESASVAANLSSIAAWSRDLISQTSQTEHHESPKLNDLVTLIQELNQCNGALMDRVSQLEDALESSQNALQAEVGRTHDEPSQDWSNVQDWAGVQEQITNLFNQLEFAHQTNQRQQILIETLTGQLESSQERVAQLEREAALVQQHYNEQTQQLAKSENSCRDLQSRLQRQQRYTLQFKAALEKSLEVPTPQYETVLSPPLAEVLVNPSGLPKAQRIQPWSAQHDSDKTPWMKLHQLDLPVEAQAPSASKSEPLAPESAAPAQTSHLNLPSFGLPLLQLSDQPTDEAINRQLEEQTQRLVSDPMLKQQLDQAVKPLADMLAEALLADQQAEQQAEQPLQSTEVNLEHSPTQAGSADELLAATMADAEDALWQDLARLIDVSTEDVVKASLSGDLAAFESIDFTTVQSIQEAPTTQPAQAAEPRQPTLPHEVSQDAATVAPLVRKLSQTAAPQPPVQSESTPQPTSSQSQLFPALANPSWPSPVVYPLRPSKKRQSLAMVDLPSFPKADLTPDPT